jgi:hypothetical protein
MKSDPVPKPSVCVAKTFLLIALLCIGPQGRGANELQIVLPLNRTVYQANEQIEISVVRAANQPVENGDLKLALQGEDGSLLNFIFAADKIDPNRGSRRAVEHLHVNGWLLRPGDYRVEVACDGAVATTNFAVFSPIRRSSFRLINWARPEGKNQLPQGEANLGFNLIYGNPGQVDQGNFIRAGVDFMANCVMGGGHQMDLRTECDWSDPYVIRGGTRRVTRRALMDRTSPNVVGVHFYDEPGLTWGKDPATGEFTPHAVPWQARSYEATFGVPPISYRGLDSQKPEQSERWAEWARWKLGLMDAAWKDAQFGVSEVRPDYTSVTQSQYGYSAFVDGYYFNVVRSLPVISGHGGYHDFGPGYFNPSMFLEFARARDFSRLNWYLPTWFGSTTADEFRLEQYLSFQCGIQGMISPPELDPGQPEKSKAAQGIVESNHLLGRLGTIFTSMPVTRPPVAVLFSLSQMIHAQTVDRKVNYAHETPHGRNLPFVYLAGKLLQHQFMVVLDEDVLDGTLAANHRAVILSSLDYLEPQVVAALEGFVKQGGLVLMTADCGVQVAGAVKLGVAPRYPDAEKIAELTRAGKALAAGQLMKMRQALAGAKILAEAIRPQLERAGIKPVLTSSEPGIVATRQGEGDIEYLLAVNATHDPAGDPMVGMKAVSAVIGLEADGRPVYDVVHGGLAKAFTRINGRMEGQFRFGPGQMRVFARTSRPVGGVRITTPVVHSDYTRFASARQLNLGAVVVDEAGGILSGAVPLHLRVIDALGTSRYDLYRATKGGILNLSLPLGINEPAGRWKVVVTELLNLTEGTADFEVAPVLTCGAAAGATPRAVYWPDDRERIFRCFRVAQEVTIVTGTSDYNQAAAERLKKILEPWNVRCVITNAVVANRSRALSQDEAATWIGLEFAGRGQIKAGDQNSPAQPGFALRGPAILLGTPDDNPLIQFLRDQKFLPYQPNRLAMPGAGRGLVAWQREGLGVNQESVTLIAYDAQGMSEAVGTMYEMIAGLEPLTRWVLPRESSIAGASNAAVPPEMTIDWSVVLPDRIDGLKVADERLLALTHDGTLSEVATDSHLGGQRVIQGVELERALQEMRVPIDPQAAKRAQKVAAAGRLVKLVRTSGDWTAVAFWGGAVQLFDRSGALKSEHRFPQDITAITWLGSRLMLGDADGRLTAVKVD